MDVPSFGTWEMLGNNVPLASIVTVATPCWGFEAQCGYRVGRTWFDFQSLFDTLLFFITVVTLPSGRGAHNIEHLAHSVNLVLLTFQSRYILFLGVQGMEFNLIIEIRCLNCA
jgi:hypothetical protein